MSETKTITGTYTVLDIRKTFEGCEADFRIIARRTDKWSMGFIDKLFYDIMLLAENFYLEKISLSLNDSKDNTEIRAVNFTVNSDGKATSGERAGSNYDWENLPNTYLSVTLTYTSKWNNLTQNEKKKFRDENTFKNDWVTSNVNTNFPHLNNNNAQLYASKGYEMQKTNFKK